MSDSFATSAEVTPAAPPVALMIASVCAKTFCDSYAASASLKPITPATAPTAAPIFAIFLTPLVTALSNVRKPNVALFPAPSSFLKSEIAFLIPFASKSETMFTPTAINAPYF